MDDICFACADHLFLCFYRIETESDIYLFSVLGQTCLCIVSMGEFIKRVMVFSLILLALLLSIELLLLRQINRYSYKREYVENHINDIQILLLGNSHIECGLNPEYMGGESLLIWLFRDENRYMTLN